MWGRGRVWMRGGGDGGLFEWECECGWVGGGVSVGGWGWMGGTVASICVLQTGSDQCVLQTSGAYSPESKAQSSEMPGSGSRAVAGAVAYTAWNAVWRPCSSRVEGTLHTDTTHGLLHVHLV